MDILNVIDFIDEGDLEDLEIPKSYLPRTRTNPFTFYSEDQFLSLYKFTKSFANKIVDIIKEDLPHDRRGGALDPQIQVACALRCWAGHDIQDDSADLHGISQQVVSKTCKNVAEALARRASTFVTMPSTLEEQQSVISAFRAISDFPSVIGAIDCTHIKIKRVGGDISEAYVNRKGLYYINVQVVCDADLKIRDIVTHCRGNMHNSHIFNESAIKERFERGEFHGQLLGDSGYACTPYIFTPIANPANQKEEAYNRAHIQARNTVEQCFALWKHRFRCLLRGMHMKLETAKTTVIALAVLHNIAIDMNENMEFIDYEPRNDVRCDPPCDDLRSDLVRSNFIQQHF